MGMKQKKSFEKKKNPKWLTEKKTEIFKTTNSQLK
jgi:hypothetical protein